MRLLVPTSNWGGAQCKSHKLHTSELVLKIYYDIYEWDIYVWVILFYLTCDNQCLQSLQLAAINSVLKVGNNIGSNCHGSSVTVTELIALSRVTKGLTTCLLFVMEVLE